MRATKTEPSHHETARAKIMISHIGRAFKYGQGKYCNFGGVDAKLYFHAF